MSGTDRRTLQRAPALIARKCHCGDWAGFRFGKSEQQEWWCWKHYPYKTSARLEAAEIADMLSNNGAKSAKGILTEDKFATKKAELLPKI
ncbi:hypothetical protein [Rhizobium leguminosarum]|uniref:hypothetical protein n=1 Tax=Rhizobium leguminosarum TaxID=384 RepID=UPI0021BBB7F7|nr:hypothetical protein [Rhizobium leguminosarum]